MIAAGKWVHTVKRMVYPFRLYTFGDTHIGNGGCAIEKLKEDVEKAAADPLAMVILMGDLADYIGIGDKRWDPGSITPNVPLKKLAEWGSYLSECTIDVFKPLKGKIFGALYGNHEDTFERRQGEKYHGRVCEALGCHNLGYCCMFDLAFRRSTKVPTACRAYRVFAHHGAGGAQTPGGKTNRLVRFMTTNEADIYLVGHVHERDVKRVETLCANGTCTEIQSRKKLGVFTGTYLRTYHQSINGGYGERAGYAPVPLGCSVIEFLPFDRDWKHRPESVSARVAI